MEKNLSDLFEEPEKEREWCCANPEIVYTNGIYYCANCGENVGVKVESTEFSNTTVCVDKHTPEQSLGIFVGGGGFMGRRNLWSIPGREKTIKSDINFIKEVCRALECPNALVDDIVNLYTELITYGVKRGDGRKGFMGACIYECCKRESFVVTPQQIATIMKIERSRITQMTGEILRRASEHGVSVYMGPMDCFELLRRCCGELQLDPYIVGKCEELLKKCKKHASLEKYNQNSLVGAIIYIVFVVEDRDCKLDAVAKTCRIKSTSTIMACVRAIIETVGKSEVRGEEKNDQ